MEIFESTSIWLNTLGKTSNGSQEKNIELLRSEFFKFRKNVSFLVSRVSATLPNLTQHEISHLDSLWDIASLIIGDDYPINPLEAFILGGAILLHDSALSFEAYQNGKSGLRETIEWKDSYAQLKEEYDQENEEIKDMADFLAIRSLHANQAEKLIFNAWIDPESKKEIYLLENTELRKHLGKLIGQIAASHHWDIEKLEQVFDSQQNSILDFPRDWRIDPLKLACILRCADAAHIDNLRAPDFLFALLKREKISFRHWLFQNKLAKVDIDQTDPLQETLLFTSTIDFSEEDSDSWFLAYDAINLIDQEIKSCNNLLKNFGHSNLQFKIKKVNGANSPEKLSKFIKVKNWVPWLKEIHISNVERIVKNLGGEMLYGQGNDFLGIALGELLQNARDAIIARTFVEKSYEGKVLIEIIKNDEDIFLVVEDNGIGMSERVLTGPLLDFGTSFWSSNLINSEFPGLRSSGFKSVGKFGIGFYSIFMIAESVSITSRNWKEGLNETRQLNFKNGFSLRPVIKHGIVETFNSNISTQIKIKLKLKLFEDDLKVRIKNSRMGFKEFLVPFQNYLSAKCGGLDVSVYYKFNGNTEAIIHENINSTLFNHEKWLQNISFINYRNDENCRNYINNNFKRIRPIYENGKVYGLAAISTFFTGEGNFLNMRTVGGLATSVHHRDSSNFIGFIDYIPKSAKRDPDENYACSLKTIQNWAEEQLSLLLLEDLIPYEKFIAASSLCEFKINPSPIAVILISYNGNSSFLNFDQLAELSMTVGIAFIESDLHGHIEMSHDLNELPNYALILPLKNSSFLRLKYFEDGSIEENYSILHCLQLAILKSGNQFKTSIIENVGVSKFRMKLSALIIHSEANQNN